ncbi:hypothetical protein [Pedobacter mucosus]|uniref:hypothetical protein n=1 Tax=Pedobacter mucosus TaxID=2895286 RepID=UPI001EE46924|nr:hypothetical protein [Pedobacter mucosus]UKT62385.1 hypothetical protein LOK61_11505 [Pedobacter mucosus]
MSAVIYTILKEYFIEVHNHPVKARIMSPIHDSEKFIFQTSLFYKSKSSDDANKPLATFTSFATAERHLLQYLEEFQNTVDLGGHVAPGSNF